jgi:GAF domain-containing protein
MTTRREEKALLEFKHIMDDVVHLLRKSTNAETVSFYWVNRARKQFVLETNSTTLPNVMFRDRVNFDQFYLEPYKEINSPLQLTVGKEIQAEQLRHYYDFVPVRHVTLVPFVNNGETVALTALETEKPLSLSEFEDEISAYRNALLNVLNTYLELTDLYENQRGWVDYDDVLERISPKMHKVEILTILVEEMQKLLPNGGISVVARGMETWATILRSSNASDVLPLGLAVEEKSMAYDALQKGKALFSIHFNQNPKRVSTLETSTEGATLAIPIMISDRRHGVLIAFDKNPLVFTEATKHQIKNMVRVAALSIQVNLGKMDVHQDIFTSEYGNFIPDLWEKSLENQIQRYPSSKEHTWFGFITIANLPKLRSKLRLDDLKRMQRKIINLLNPSNTGFNGFIGFNTDYIFSYLLVGENNQVQEQWIRSIHKTFEKPIELGDGQLISVEIQSSAIPIDGNSDVHSVTLEAKRKLSGDVKNENSSAINR